MANVVVSAIATFNGKALKKGQKELSAFDKQAQKLGKTFNRVFAATAITSTIIAAESANMFVSNMPVSNIIAWANAGPVEKLIIALTVGTAIS